MNSDVLGSVDPWVGTLVALASVALAYWRTRIRTTSALERHAHSEAVKEAEDRAAFRRTLLEHVAYVEDKRRALEDRMTEMEQTHRREMASLHGRLEEAHKRHLECEERLIALVRGDR